MQALSGIRVLDLTHVIAGPFCTHQLGVQGAEVIKIEDANNPDIMRFDGADLRSNKEGMSSVFLAQAANKKSIAIDLKQEPGQQVLKKLITGADVLVENYRSGALQKIGLGYDQMKQINAKLIYCSMTGFGQTGPKREHTAYDNVIQAFSGMMDATGSVESGPMKVGPPVLDYGTGSQAAFAIVSALFRRSQTGLGQYIDISMLDSALMLMGNLMMENQVTNEASGRHGNRSANRPGYGCFDTAEGQLMIGAWTTTQLKDMWLVLDQPARAEAISEEHPMEIMDTFTDTVNEIQKVLLTRPAAEWEDLMNQQKVPAARVRNVHETLREEQLQSRGVKSAIEGEDSDRYFPCASFLHKEDSPTVRSAPPQFAEHTRTILQEVGYNESELESLAACGAIRL
ncbi:MAG: crotonobetainyl-CoA:carnitine CoA-transferase CaiB-like acyl-CoA transferase [Parasphingorhabdus sp.]|jgi:crotonobetainyl-CoA:carnitine CoA-transferase CaiB-like acyl-CoA transferase